MKKSLALMVGLCFVGLLVEAAVPRQGAAGQFGLRIDGSNFLGFVKSYSGGFIRGEVATDQRGRENVVKKHITKIAYEPFTVEVGMGMSNDFYEWISATWDKGQVTKNVELLATDFDKKVQSIREFRDAYITEVTIPTLDGSSKDPAYMTIKTEPSKIFYRPGDGSTVGAKSPTKTKKWLSSNFRITLGDLPCTRVAKVDSFTWKQGVIKDEVELFRELTRITSKAVVPNLKLTISMADIEPWMDWHKSFVIDGMSSDSEELGGSIEFLGPDLITELATIDLSHVGIISIETDRAEANKEEVARFEVELYVEQMAFSYNEE